MIPMTKAQLTNMTGQLNDHQIMRIHKLHTAQTQQPTYMCEDSTGETLFQISMFITHCQKHCYYYYYAHMHIQYYIGYIHMWV